MSTRKQAPRPAKPVGRYWKGKAPKGAAAAIASDSDSENEADEQVPLEAGDIAIGGEQTFGAEDEEDEEEEFGIGRGVGEGKKGMNVALREVQISREGKVIVAGREESGRTAVEEEEEESEEEESDDETKPGQAASDESREYESSSEEEEKPKLQFRPVFVPKRARATVAERDALAQDTEAAEQKKAAALEARKQQSHDMVAESIKRELAEKEKEEDVPDVDDTDGLDPTGEFEAWRLRELSRIARDKAEAVARDEERAEIERRRALPEAQRLAEDLAHAQSSRDAKPKGAQKFLQKYWHKGAFHQDAEILQRHDFTEATASTVDVSMLPKVMQVRNFGKRSRTKYTHLVDQDTTGGNGGFGGAGDVKRGGTATGQGAGCFLCGGPHMKKDCPQNREVAPGLRPATGANGVGAGTRQWGGPGGQDDGRSWKDRDDRPPVPRDDWRRDDRRGGDRDTDDRRDEQRRRPNSRERARDRSRSPPRRDRERWRDDRRRERSRSPRSRGEEKRRRLD